MDCLAHEVQQRAVCGPLLGQGGYGIRRFRHSHWHYWRHGQPLRERSALVNARLWWLGTHRLAGRTVPSGFLPELFPLYLSRLAAGQLPPLRGLYPAGRYCHQHRLQEIDRPVLGRDTHQGSPHYGPEGGTHGRVDWWRRCGRARQPGHDSPDTDSRGRGRCRREHQLRPLRALLLGNGWRESHHPYAWRGQQARESDRQLLRLSEL